MTWPFGDLRPFGYSVLSVDPPWYFKNRSAAGESKNPVAHYKCMPIEDILALPVGHLAHPDGCLLWMWATWPMLPQAMACMARWGFAYKTGGAWHKRTTHGKTAFGPGYVLRSASEPFLIGAVGRPRLGPDAARIRGLIDTEIGADELVLDAKTREHSRKPDEQYAMLGALVPEGARAELFARQPWPGWEAWGDQADKFAADRAAAPSVNPSTP